MAAVSRSRMQQQELYARVDDYLDDQIQTAGDLDGVSELIARVQEQQDLLKQQVSRRQIRSSSDTYCEQLQDAQAALAVAQRDADAQAKELKDRAETFEQSQASIDQRLQEVTGSDDSDDAVRAFESRMVKLRRLDVATGYLEIYQEVDRYGQDARTKLKTHPESALESYTKLRGLTRKLQLAQPDAEGAAPHLIDSVEQDTSKLKEDIQESLVRDFHETLRKIKWPQKEVSFGGRLVSTWSEQATLLLRLQEPDLIIRDKVEPGSPQSQQRVLLPLEIMVQPLAHRFRYHFYGEKPTNRLDKPEYFLSHVLDLIDKHSVFVNEAFQSVLDVRTRSSDELDLVYSDATSELVTALLPMIMAKSLSVLPQMTAHPQLLSHFIHELMSFDSTLRDTWGYTPVAGAIADWKGLTWEVLIAHNYCETWLAVEKDFALARYRTIRDGPDNTDIDYDGVEASQTKPTKGAIRVNDLLETITDRYRGLSSFSQKMKFLIEVQLSIFDDYHQHLHGALQAYLASSHTAGRLLQGQSKSEALGEKGLSSLCKIYGSAEHLERKMEDWGDDLFFLELWEELQDRAKVSNADGGKVGHDLHVNEVAAKTSNTIKQNSDQEVEADNGALFDETATSYRKLKEAAEGELLRLLDVNARDAVAPLANVETWASLSTPTTDLSALSPSPALDAMLQTISVIFGFLGKVIARAPLRKMAKHFCATLQVEMINQVILRHDFSAAGVLQLKRDVQAIESVIDTTVGITGVAAASLQRLDQTIRLLGLPIKASGQPTTTTDDDEWGFDENEGTEQADEDTEMPDILDEEKSYGLWEAEKAIFKSNEAARHALSEMGLDNLSEIEARSVLKRRVEINS